MIRIAVLGCGRIGVMHAANIAAHPRARLAGVHNNFVPSAEAVSARAAAKVSASGGIFGDMTILDCDIARLVPGEEVETLDDRDTGKFVLPTAKGKQSAIGHSRRAACRHDQQRVETFGSAGMVVSGNRRRHAMRLAGETETYVAAPLPNFFIGHCGEAFDAEIDAFVTAIETGTAPEVGFEDGVQALVLAEAALRSVREGRAVKLGEVA